MTRPLRLAAMSDLHIEFESPEGPRRPTAAWFALRKARRALPGHPDAGPLLDHLREVDVDIVVMAGDIDTGVRGISYANKVSQFLDAPVVYVAGNHEAYGHDLSMLIPELRKAAQATDGRVVFLENDVTVFDLGGRRIHVLGCTAWTGYRLNGDSDADIGYAMLDAANGLNDHVSIRLDGGRFTPEMARERHWASRTWLGDKVARIRNQEGDDATIVIVTHHAPIPEANPPDYRASKLAPAFVSDMRAEIMNWQPTMWVWGHAHHGMRTDIGQTKLVSSQRGYVCVEPGAEAFRPEVVEI